MPISSPNPMFDNMLESSHQDNSNKWSNIGFGREITQIVDWIKFYKPYRNTGPFSRLFIINAQNGTSLALAPVLVVSSGTPWTWVQRPGLLWLWRPPRVRLRTPARDTHDRHTRPWQRTLQSPASPVQQTEPELQIRSIFWFLNSHLFTISYVWPLIRIVSSRQF